MRRFRERQAGGLFRGGEMARFATMIGMLLVVAMLIRKARDPDTWRFLANDPSPVMAASDAAPPADAPPADDPGPAEGAPAAEVAPAAEGDETEATADKPPLDEDAEERAAVADEFLAITDRAPIVKEDMFAYWRFLRWTESAKLPEMLRRARNVRYGDLILDPAAHRGELIKVRLHVVQLLKIAAAPDNPLGIQTYYQAVGWNDDSQAWFYFCIFTDLPAGMPIGERIVQEGTFVGYFLKTTTYQDGAGKQTQAPVLIGRMVWHPMPQAKPGNDESLMSWLILGVVVVGFGLRMVWRLNAGKKREPLTGLLRSSGGEGEEPHESVEDWLDRAESTPADEAINEPNPHESNGNASDHSRSFPRDGRLDRSDER